MSRINLFLFCLVFAIKILTLLVSIDCVVRPRGGILGILGWGCAAGTRATVQLNFAAPY